MRKVSYGRLGAQKIISSLFAEPKKPSIFAFESKKDE